MRRAARVVGRALRTPVTGPARGIRKVTHAQGAGESGLGRLIELHGVNGAGDVMITVALASTVFFSVPTDEARGRVALYLAVTMLPFTLLAPVVGPLLDRLPHGRRAAMAGSMLARAVLALVLSGAVATGSLEMYPAALGVLVASKAYGVVRSAVVPRLLPQGFSLVKANSRVTLGGLLATGVAAPVGAGLQMIGPGWPLYGACLLFLGGAFLSFRLPPKVDSARGERRALLAADEQHLAAAVDARWDPVAEPVAEPAAEPVATGADRSDGTRNRGREKDRDKERRRKGPGLRTVGPAVTHALAANACVRCQSGFLIFFLAFLLREHPLTGQSAAVSLAVVGVAAGAGNALGTAVGAWLRARAPEVIIVTVVGALVAVAVSAAVFFGAAVVAVLGAVAGFTQALAKLSLDALIQRDVPELVRTSAFARSETLLQMAWVVGGAIGIALPLRGPLGLSVGALIVALGWLTTVRALMASARRGASHPRVA
ncbi:MULTISPECIES: MFS transporter [Streptomyces]|uniref:MFS transporter n=1 Tax=Streptomyces TaxID=1883 RepID=UPI0003C2FBA1|nr:MULTISPECIES: MFS transporter [unclassified Streptomyces]QOZ99834.1 MFS transporter [Streptomyces violascens]ESP98933.1 Integral membrane protein [Streptomyces sp. GBA 94-10 4N24]ESQ04757.1 Integral membrane protein [Streptomyces sp. PVA_94-07]RPK56927.1 Major Facilitator Superfamily protein [Streptomyces sp. ADI96-15]UZN59441.1 Integral membrane protein [Streptomyces sp. GBA 94-10 4N24]